MRALLCYTHPISVISDCTVIQKVTYSYVLNYYVTLFQIVWLGLIKMQGRSQPHSPGWARVPLSSFLPQISIYFSYFSSKLYLFSSSILPAGWATRPPGKTLATPLSKCGVIC